MVAFITGSTQKVTTNLKSPNKTRQLRLCILIIINIKTLLMILEPFSNLTLSDKALLLHTLFPNQIAELIQFIQGHIAMHSYALAKTLINIDGGTSGISENKFLEIVELLSEKVNKDFSQLASNAQTFAETFTKGFNQFVFLECLDEFTVHCTDDDLRHGIQFLFDL